ncbi:MAG: alpha/beta fold hydrolase [Actinomycetota bacterium]
MRAKPTPPEPLAALVESKVDVPRGGSLGYAEFGDPTGDPVVWFHATPGARKQFPPDAHALAVERRIRLIGVERPGTGLSTRFNYRRIMDWADDVEAFADGLGLDRFAVVGLSGGSPYVLAACHRLPDRVVAGAVLGGIGPTRGPEAAPGYTRMLPLLEPFLSVVSLPLAEVLTWVLRPIRRLASPGYDTYTNLVAPGSDREVLRAPEMKSAFLYDLTTALEVGLRAPMTDLVLFGREWGFSLRDIRVPVKVWHGDADAIVPLSHGEWMASLIPGAELVITPGGGHFAGYIVAMDVLDWIVEKWPPSLRGPARERRGW